MKNLIVEREWAMPNHKTFEIKPINRLLVQELGEDWKNTTTDPFPFPYKEDALGSLSKHTWNTVNQLVFDPPYSLRQLQEVYKGLGRALTQRESQRYWSDLKDVIAFIVKPGGKVISFGWNSCGIGKTRGFEIQRILIVCHGGHHNDTICTVEKKVQGTL